METLLQKIDKYYLRGAIKSYWNFVIERAKGPYLFSVDGTKYLDYSLGGGPMILGHCHPSVMKAVHEQVKRGWQFYIVNDRNIQSLYESSGDNKKKTRESRSYPKVCIIIGIFLLYPFVSHL